MRHVILIGKGEHLPWKRKKLKDNACHLEGDSMHSMTTNDERFHDKYDKFRPDYRNMKNMTRQG